MQKRVSKSIDWFKHDGNSAFSYGWYSFLELGNVCQRRIQNPVKHVRLSFFAKIVNGGKLDLEKVANDKSFPKRKPAFHKCSR